MTTSVVIPNYNGAKLLRENLPKVLAMGASEVIVVDDASTDESIEVIKDIKVIRHKKNLGFARSVNDGVEASSADVVVLLNTDVTPRAGLLDATLPHFKNPAVFAVSFNEEKYGYARGVFHRGLIEHRGEASQKPEISFWASGGSAAFDRKKWQELGGLDIIYAPFYWEDMDISYRAQAKGWKIVWEPRARVEHEHDATIGKLASSKTKTWISERNQFIFFWKNISSPKFWLLHLIWLPYRLFPPGRLIPFFWALLKFPAVIKRRIKNRSWRRVSDEEIINRYR